jgi:hypothetical protein
MKKILYFSSIFLFLATFFSCSPDKGDESYLSNRTPFAYFNASSGSLFVEDAVESSFDVKIALSAPQSSDLTYTVEVDPSSVAVEGVDFTIVPSSNVIPNGNIVTTFKVVGIFDQAIIEGKDAIFNLVAVEGAEVKWRTKFTLSLLKLCPYNGLNTLTYRGAPRAFDEDAPNFNANLLPVAGTTNQWTVSSAWGPNFVGWATGSAANNGRFIYPARIVLNDDFTVTVIGLASYAQGGTGIFSPCTQTFTFTLNQTLFTNPFTVDVVLTPAN